MPSREARAQLEASGLGCHVAVKRAGMDGREAYWSAAARDCGKARGKNLSRERDNGTPRMCAPGERAAHHGGKQLSGATEPRTEREEARVERKLARSVNGLLTSFS